MNYVSNLKLRPVRLSVKFDADGFDSTDLKITHHTEDKTGCLTIGDFQVLYDSWVWQIGLRMALKPDNTVVVVGTAKCPNRTPIIAHCERKDGNVHASAMSCVAELFTEITRLPSIQAWEGLKPTAD